MNQQIKENDKGHIIVDGEHKIFFLCDKETDCNNDLCTHTAYLEKSKNYKAFTYDSGFMTYFNNVFNDHFEKLYFTDDNYDWWEKERIWNCRTNEWEDVDETSEDE